LRFLYVSFLLAFVSGCSNSGSDRCGVTGEWVLVSKAQNDGYRMTFNNPISFNSNKTITGGATDGVPMVGWTATNWKCVDDTRVVLSAEGSAPMGGALARRMMVENSSVIRFKGLLFDGDLVRRQDTEAATVALWRGS